MANKMTKLTFLQFYNNSIKCSSYHYVGPTPICMVTFTLLVKTYFFTLHVHAKINATAMKVTDCI